MTSHTHCELILVRHGETDWNKEGRIQGQIDVPLNRSGVAQAKATASALRDRAIETLYSSDLQRAAQTAALIAETTGCAITYDAGLRERNYGEFEGQSIIDLPNAFPRVVAGPIADVLALPAPGGESRPEFYARGQAALIRLLEAQSGGRVALVTHGGILDCAYRLATRISIDEPRRWPIKNASINEFVWDKSELRLVLWGDVSHLGVALDEGQVVNVR